MGLVLFRRPGTVAVLDDDEDFLQIVESALRKRWRTLSFSSAQALLEHAKMEIPFDDADLWMQQESIARWRSGVSSLPAEILASWARNSERFALTRVVIVDHLIPPTTALELLGQTRDWRALRVMLTGYSDSALAIRAFNAGLIHRFLSKQDDQMAEHLLWTVAELMEAPDSRLEVLWRTTLSREQAAALNSPGAASALEQFLAELFVEHVVTAEPFGFLGITQHGLVGWVPLSIGNRPERVTDRAILATLHANEEPRTAKPITFEDGVLYGGCFHIDRLITAPPSSHSAWRRQNSQY